MVIFISQAGAKPAIPPLRTLVWKIQNTQDEVLNRKWTRDMPRARRKNAHMPQRRKPQMRISDAPVQQSGRNAKHAGHHRTEPRENVLKPPKLTGWLHKAGKYGRWTCCGWPSNHPQRSACRTRKLGASALIRRSRLGVCVPSPSQLQGEDINASRL